VDADENPVSGALLAKFVRTAILELNRLYTLANSYDYHFSPLSRNLTGDRQSTGAKMLSRTGL